MTYDATGSAGAGSAVGDQSATEQAKEKVAEVASQAQDTVRGAVGDQVDQRSDQAAEKVESVADDVRAVSESLEDRGQDAAARIVEQGADYAQQLSDYLRRSGSDQILGDVESFARRQPWAVAAGGLLIGFAASRVLRASAASSTSGSRETGSYPSGGAPGDTYAGSDAYLPVVPAGDPYATGTGTYPGGVSPGDQYAPIGESYPSNDTDPLSTTTGSDRP